MICDSSELLTNLFQVFIIALVLEFLLQDNLYREVLGTVILALRLQSSLFCFLSEPTSFSSSSQVFLCPVCLLESLMSVLVAQKILQEVDKSQCSCTAAVVWDDTTFLTDF